MTVLETAPTGAEWAGSYTLPNDFRSPGLGRMLLRQALVGCPPDLVDSAVLVVSELITNAVRHAETELVLRISLAPGLRVVIEDASADPISDELAAADTEDGRGLTIVQAVATRWGWERTDAGKRIWFEM